MADSVSLRAETPNTPHSRNASFPWRSGHLERCAPSDFRSHCSAFRCESCHGICPGAPSPTHPLQLHQNWANRNLNQTSNQTSTATFHNLCICTVHAGVRHSGESSTAVQFQIGAARGSSPRPAGHAIPHRISGFHPSRIGFSSPTVSL